MCQQAMTNKHQLIEANIFQVSTHNFSCEDILKGEYHEFVQSVYC